MSSHYEATIRKPLVIGDKTPLALVYPTGAPTVPLALVCNECLLPNWRSFVTSTYLSYKKSRSVCNAAN